jgi:hypothetical protein
MWRKKPRPIWAAAPPYQRPDALASGPGARLSTIMLNALVTALRHFHGSVKCGASLIMDSYRDFPSEFESFAGSSEREEAAAAPIGTDERRMHVRAYNYWVSLLDGRPFPSIEDSSPTSSTLPEQRACSISPTRRPRRLM